MIIDGKKIASEISSEIEKEINNMMGNKSHPYWDRSHPGHKAAVAEMEALWKAKSS